MPAQRRIPVRPSPATPSRQAVLGVASAGRLTCPLLRRAVPRIPVTDPRTEAGQSNNRDLVPELPLPCPSRGLSFPTHQSGREHSPHSRRQEGDSNGGIRPIVSGHGWRATWPRGGLWEPGHSEWEPWRALGARRREMSWALPWLCPGVGPAGGRGRTSRRSWGCPPGEQGGLIAPQELPCPTRAWGEVAMVPV